MNAVKLFQFLLVFALTAELLPTTTAHAATSPRITSIVTGANGYIGREIVHTLLKEPYQQQVRCLVRPARIPEEQAYWNESARVMVLPYDMLDDGSTLERALDCALERNPSNCCVYHVASVFGPTEDHLLFGNVEGGMDQGASRRKYLRRDCHLVV